MAICDQGERRFCTRGGPEQDLLDNVRACIGIYPDFKAQNGSSKWPPCALNAEDRRARQVGSNGLLFALETHAHWFQPQETTS